MFTNHLIYPNRSSSMIHAVQRVETCADWRKEFAGHWVERGLGGFQPSYIEQIFLIK